jgi:23S rRNA (uracil1939-C5)-methyltransferase
VVLTTLKNLKVKNAIEFGSGIGNFTLPLASVCEHVDALEIDPLACQSLAQTIVNSGLQHKITVHQGDFQRLSEKHVFHEANLVFVDPPRSGLKYFLDSLFAKETAKDDSKYFYFIYVSCFLESFLIDSKKLIALGYQCRQVTLVDQFPQTPHTEMVALFTRS